MSERERFEAYLATVDHPAADMARDVWRRAVEQTPTLRAPEAGLSADGDYYFGWNYGDLPGLTMTLTFLRDEPVVDWFFRDKAKGVVVGAESREVVPDSALAHLRAFARLPDSLHLTRRGSIDGPVSSPAR